MTLFVVSDRRVIAWSRRKISFIVSAVYRNKSEEWYLSDGVLYIDVMFGETNVM